jgi:hypothetical protein
MNRRQFLLLTAAFSAIAALLPIAAVAAPAATGDETIVLIRHGEKPANDLGQLSCQGLNRALALPDVLIGKFGKPDFIFAPLTRKKLEHSGAAYSYVRPLMTIEPTAIRLGLPVDARFPFDDIGDLQRELKSDPYRSAVIFVAWEHHLAEDFARSILKSLKADPKQVPVWQGDDFDSIYLIKIHTEDGKRTATFTVDHEGLNGQSKDCPGAAKAQ